MIIKIRKCNFCGKETKMENTDINWWVIFQTTKEEENNDLNDLDFCQWECVDNYFARKQTYRCEDRYSHGKHYDPLTGKMCPGRSFDQT